MTARTILVLALAAVCGLSAVAGVTQLLQMRGGGPQADMVPVVMATEDISRGSVLSASFLKVENRPKKWVPDGTASSLDDVVGRCVLVSLVKDAPVLERKLAAKDAGYGLAAMLPDGMRAFTIRTPNVATGVGGFILPGNKVDVLLTTNGTGRRDVTGGGVTTTLLQYIEILAVDQRLDAPDNNKVDPKTLKSVTLKVTPDQALKLALGMNKGLLHLSLRNSEDRAEADTRPATMADLRFSQGRLTQPTSPTGAAGDVVVANYVSPISYGEIRTIRGSNQGTVRIEF
jgi:pilus assembly protein CpaB